MRPGAWPTVVVVALVWNTSNTRWWYSERYYALEGSRVRLVKRREDVSECRSIAIPLWIRSSELNCGT